MAKKYFTSDSLATLIDEIKSFVASAVSKKSDSGHNHDDRYYTETEVNNKLDAKVPTSRTINGKALSSNITLSAGDVSAYTKTEIDNMEFITVDDIDTICGSSIQMAREVTF